MARKGRGEVDADASFDALRRDRDGALAGAKVHRRLRLPILPSRECVAEGWPPLFLAAQTESYEESKCFATYRIRIRLI
jgi:hypothetical protein